MTRLVGAIAMVLLGGVAQVSAGDLTLRDVIELHRSGLGEDLVIAVIEADGGPFQLSFADIHDLKGDGLSERIITALVRTGVRAEAPAGAPHVEVHQNVTLVPGLVTPIPVLSDVDRRRGDSHQTSPRRAPFDHQIVVPPATWIARPENRRKAGPSDEGRSKPPAATWVTPNPGRAASPQPRPEPAPGAASEPRR